MKIVAIAVLFVLMLSLSAFAAPVCKDINTGAAIECPTPSTVMPWDAAQYLGPPMDHERAVEWTVFFSGCLFIFALAL